MRNAYRLCICLLMAVLIGLCFNQSAAAKENVTWIDENTCKVENLDDNGNRIKFSEGCFEKLRTFSDGGLTMTEMFLDGQGNPMKYSNSYSGTRQVVDEAGNVISKTFLDAEQKVITGPDGYASVTYGYDGSHQVREMYFDENGKPTVSSRGCYGITRDAFDSKSRVIAQTYVDAAGKPMLQKGGYASFKREYSEDGRQQTYMYFGVSGEPVVLWRGQCGEYREYDEQRREVLLTYLDAQGQPMVCREGFVTVRKTYSQQSGALEEEWYYDINDNLYTSARGQSGTRFRQEGGQSVEVPIDAAGKELFFLDQYLMQHSSVVALGALVVLLVAMVLPRKLQWALLAVYTVFVLYMTLLTRETRDELPVMLDLMEELRKFVTSSAHRSHMLKNLVLFVPFGFLLCQLKPRWWMLLVPLLLSAGVEAVQMLLHLGYFEIGDILMNSLGGILGGLAGFIVAAIRGRKNRKRRKGKYARR